MTILPPLGLALYVGALAFAAGSDLLRYQIPNRVALALALAFLLYAPALPLRADLLHLSAGLAILVLGALCFFLGVIGGGDAKLLAATALWTGWGLLLPFLFVTSIAGGVLAACLLVLRRVAPKPLPPGRWYGRLLARGEGVPYGIAIAVSGLILLPSIAAPVLR